MAVIQPRPTYIPYQCAKFGDDRALFNVIFDVCYVQHVKGLYPYFDISVFYFSVISRCIDLKFIQDTYVDTSLYALSNETIKTWASTEITSQKIRQYLTFNM